MLSAYSGQEKRHHLQMSSGLGWKALFYFTLIPLSASVPFSADNTKITLRKVSGDQTKAGHTCQRSPPWSWGSRSSLLILASHNQWIICLFGEWGYTGSHYAAQTRLDCSSDLIFSFPFYAWWVFLFISCFVLFFWYWGALKRGPHTWRGNHQTLNNFPGSSALFVLKKGLTVIPGLFSNLQMFCLGLRGAPGTHQING